MPKKLTTDGFIKKAHEIHGDKYDYSEAEYVNSETEIEIICPKHGKFKQIPKYHLQGSGCRECAYEKNSNNRKFTTEQFIEKCKEVWGEQYSYEHTVYTNVNGMVTVTCPIHGDFETRANDFLRKHGCSRCSRTKKLTTEEFIRRAKEIHGDRYDYSKVKYVNNRTEVCIICPIHGEFWQKPVLHLKGNGCQKCFQNFKKTTEQFIKDARKVHGDKYDYSKVNYQGNKKYVTITCPKHGDFEQKPLSHLQGQGCQKCYDERRGNTIRVGTDEFIRRSKEIHGDKYDYSKVDYKRGSIEVPIICPKHGEFWQRPDKHMQGHGCPICGDEQNGFNKRLTTEQFIERARQIHGDKYDYSKVDYKTTNDYVTIICPKHGDFEQRAAVHICGCGCQTCNESGLEREVGLLLERKGILFVKQKGFDWLGKKLLDFYIPRYHLAIECQGLQHFNSVKHFGGNEELEKRIKLDIAKYMECTENGVKTIYVVRDKNGINYNDSIYSGIYSNNIFEISEFEKKLKELC